MTGALDTSELSIPIQFLHELSISEVAALEAHILLKDKPKLLINLKNVDEEMTPEEIGFFISITSKDGRWFYDCPIFEIVLFL
jgi:hypothetical protein